MDTIRRVIDDGCPAGAFYYALQPLTPSESPSRRYPKATNYQLRPTYEPPEVPPGTYRVLYYPSDLPTVPFGFQKILVVPDPHQAVSQEQQQLARELAALPAERESLPTAEELRLQRTQNANDFLTHRFAVAVQRDAHVVARDAFYTSEVKDLLDRSRNHSADAQHLSKTLAEALDHHSKTTQANATQMLELAERSAKLVSTIIDTALVRVEQIKVPPPPPPPPSPPPPPPDWMGGLNNLTSGVRDVLIAYIHRNNPNYSAGNKIPTTQAMLSDSGGGSPFEDALVSLLGQAAGTPNAAPKSPVGGSEKPFTKEGDDIDVTPEAQKFRDLIRKNFKSRAELESVIDVLLPDLPKK